MLSAHSQIILPANFQFIHQQLSIYTTQISILVPHDQSLESQIQHKQHETTYINLNKFVTFKFQHAGYSESSQLDSCN